MSIITPLLTRWGKEFDKNCPLSGYPRPQLKRDNWQCLNGVWEYAIANDEPAKYTGEIIVPFSPESTLSGVGRQLLPGQTLWYRRNINFEKTPEGKRLLLHFGAVDQYCEVFIDGEHVGGHEGGYWPFHFDITDFIGQTGNDVTLTVGVWDNSETGIEAYGKQNLDRGGIWYTAQSGIWQTVWTEVVPAQHIQGIKITPDYESSSVEFKLSFSQEGAPAAHISIYDCGNLIAQSDGTSIGIPNFKPWSPDNPHLYTVKIKTAEDEVESYFGMRKFGIADERLTLNGEPIFHTGLLDQGYWSDGMLTPPSDEAMIWELTEIKKLGFNMLRKHIKIEPLRWYYHCDRLGILVWQDFVNGGGPYGEFVSRYLPFADVRIKDERLRSGFGRMNPKGMKAFKRDLSRTVELLYNTVSLSVWVPFNEGWGQFEANKITEKLRELDSTRQIDHASGWHDQGGGDFASHHVYYKPFKFKPDKLKRVQALTEFGGYSLPIEGHIPSTRPFGYKFYKNKKALTKAFKKLYETEVIPNVEKGLSASVYTQLSDIEDEINGLFTCDRAELKLNPETVLEINKKLTGKQN